MASFWQEHRGWVITFALFAVSLVVWKIQGGETIFPKSWSDAFPFAQQAGVGMNIRPKRNPVFAPVAHTLLNFETMQWGFYLTTTGEPPFLWRSGTFSFGLPAPSNPSSSAAMKLPEAAADAPQAVGPLDLAFNDFCDGLRLEIGDNNLVGGNHTGCEAGLVAGNVTFNFVSFPFDQQAGFGLTLGTFPNETGGVLTLLNFATMQFADYANAAGEVPVLVRSGTFRMGVPTAAQGSLPSTLSR